MQEYRLLVSVVVETARQVEHVSLNSITIEKKNVSVCLKEPGWYLSANLQFWVNLLWTIRHYQHHVWSVGILSHRQTVEFEWIWWVRHLHWIFALAVPILQNYMIESVAARIASICVDFLTHADINAAKTKKKHFSILIWPSVSKYVQKKTFCQCRNKFVHTETRFIHSLIFFLITSINRCFTWWWVQDAHIHFSVLTYRKRDWNKKIGTTFRK